MQTVLGNICQISFIELQHADSLGEHMPDFIRRVTTYRESLEHMPDFILRVTTCRQPWGTYARLHS